MGAYEYELYKNGKIYKQSIDTANNFIENRFLHVMFEIDNNVNNLLEKYINHLQILLMIIGIDMRKNFLKYLDGMIY
jgi:hypothetical protein